MKALSKRLRELQGDHRDARCAGTNYRRWQPKIVRMVKKLARKASRRDGKRESNE